MATEKQVEANRRNAQRSTGPRTAEGKGRSRYNAITHGLRARGLDLLPHEDPELFRDRIDAWFDDYRPMEEAEAELVRHAAVLSWKIDRAERHEAAALSARVRLATAAAEEARLGRLHAAEDDLTPSHEVLRDPRYAWKPAAPALAEASRTAEGRRMLLRRWESYRNEVTSQRAFTTFGQLTVIRLMGAGPHDIQDPELLDLLVANLVVESRGDFPADIRRVSERLLGMTVDPEARHRAVSRRPADVEEARARMLAIIDRHVEVLKKLNDDRMHETDEVAEAAEIASFDPSPEGERLRRYISSLRREFTRTLDAIDRLRQRRARLEKELAKLGQESDYVHAGTDMMTAPVDPIATDDAGDDAGPTGLTPAGSVRSSDVPENGANEANLDPENGASEANLGESVQALFGDVPEGASEEPSGPPAAPFARPRTMAKRARAAARLLKKARSGR